MKCIFLGAVLCYRESCAIGRAYLKLQLKASVTHAVVYIRGIHIMLSSEFSKMLSYIHTWNSYYAIVNTPQHAVVHTRNASTWNVLACLSMQLYWAYLSQRGIESLQTKYYSEHFFSTQGILVVLKNVTQIIIESEILQLYLPIWSQSEDLGKAGVIHFFWPFHFYFLRKRAHRRKVGNRKTHVWKNAC